MAIKVTGVVTLLQVFDMPTSLQFYRDLLGFEVVQRSSDSDDCGWAWLRLNDAEIMLNTAFETEQRPATPDPARHRSHADTTLFLGCPDVDEAYSTLSASGVRLGPPVNAPYGMRQLSFNDPDGYGICLQWAVSESAV